MTENSMTRFSQDELNQCQNWLLPDVSSEKTLPSAEKEAADRSKEHARQQALETASGDGATTSSEAITSEIIASEDGDVQPMTAEQLQAITETAEKEGYDSGYKAGFDKGQQEGHAAGHQQGLDGGKQAVAQLCENLQHIIDALMIPLQTEQKQLQSFILDTVCQLTTAVVRRELSIDSSQLVDLVDAALNSMPPSTEKFTLYINPQDQALLQSHLQNHSKMTDKDLVYHLDQQLLPGGCRLETRQALVDCSIEQRLQEVIDGFLHQQFSANNSGQSPDEGDHKLEDNSQESHHQDSHHQDSKHPEKNSQGCSPAQPEEGE